MIAVSARVADCIDLVGQSDFHFGDLVRQRGDGLRGVS